LPSWIPASHHLLLLALPTNAAIVSSRSLQSTVFNIALESHAGAGHARPSDAHRQAACRVGGAEDAWTVKPRVRTHPRMAAGLPTFGKGTPGYSHPPWPVKRADGDLVPPRGTHGPGHRPPANKRQPRRVRHAEAVRVLQQLRVAPRTVGSGRDSACG
jgi:hypothetical protein